MALPIFADRLPVGVIDADREGPRIIYERSWREARNAFPISLSMPLSAAAWSAEVATPWLMNLLPEGE
ncbi:MAG: phosphatidylinositol kinase [Bradyrhizobium sp.]|nr:phosphatidylinositol kinase [Bradyrhizobium sp.]